MKHGDVTLDARSRILGRDGDELAFRRSTLIEAGAGSGYEPMVAATAARSNRVHWVMSPSRLGAPRNAPQTTRHKLALLTASPLGLFGAFSQDLALFTGDVVANQLLVAVHPSSEGHEQ